MSKNLAFFVPKMPGNQGFSDGLRGAAEQKQKYPTAVVAADGSTYTGPILNKKNFVTGAETKMSKYTDSNHKLHTESVGFCIYKKGIANNEAPFTIEGTQATDTGAIDKEGNPVWNLHSITVEKLLKETEKIRSSWEPL